MLAVGDWVEVLAPERVLATLDDRGTLDRLPFMPEMLRHCGRRYRVRLRAERTCARGIPAGEPSIRRLDGAVTLEDLRCDGSSHGGCQLGCALLWKEAWLRRVDPSAAAPAPPRAGSTIHLPVDGGTSPPAWVCQGTELLRATRPGDPPWRPGQYLRMWRVGTLGAGELAAMVARIAAAKLSARLRPPGRGRAPGPPPPEALGLRPGDWVEVRSAAEIRATLDAAGRHRGLSFSHYMYRHCGRRMRVASRIERIVVEETGAMRTVRDTVALEGSVCERHQGCARAMPSLWREAWLRRADGPGA